MGRKDPPVPEMLTIPRLLQRAVRQYPKGTAIREKDRGIWQSHTWSQYADNEDIKEFYLGLSGVGQRKNYRDVKHYKRRKRWLS